MNIDRSPGTGKHRGTERNEIFPTDAVWEPTGTHRRTNESAV